MNSRSYGGSPRSGTPKQVAMRDAKRPTNYSELLSLAEASRRFGVSERRVYRWAHDGLVHPVKPQGRVLYPEWELRRLVENVFEGGG